MTTRTSSSACILLLLSGCAIVNGQRDAPEAAFPRRIVLVGAWSNCSGGPERAELVDVLSHETSRLGPLLKRLAGHDAEVVVLEDPEPAKLFDTLTNDHRPLWFIYNGIGTVRRERSYLCLRNGQVPVDQVIEARPSESPYATYLINACHSAYVDPRRDNTVVISAGPELVGNVDNKIVLGQDLAAGLSKGLDLDANGVIDSRELFTALDRVHVRKFPVAVKLRSQSWRPLPLFWLGRERTGASSALPEALLARETAFRAGRAAPAVAAPAILWWIPKEIDKLEKVSANLERVDTLETAKTIASASMATMVLAVSEDLGSLVARDIGTGVTLWRRPANLPAQEQLRDRDIQEILYGFETLDKGRVRRYLNPIPGGLRKDIDRAGFIPSPCLEPTGQCFKRVSTTAGPP